MCPYCKTSWNFPWIFLSSHRPYLSISIDKGKHGPIYQLPTTCPPWNCRTHSLSWFGDSWESNPGLSHSELLSYTGLQLYLSGLVSLALLSHKALLGRKMYWLHYWSFWTNFPLHCVKECLSSQLWQNEKQYFWLLGTKKTLFIDLLLPILLLKSARKSFQFGQLHFQHLIDYFISRYFYLCN